MGPFTVGLEAGQRGPANGVPGAAQLGPGRQEPWARPAEAQARDLNSGSLGPSQWGPGALVAEAQNQADGGPDQQGSG